MARDYWKLALVIASVSLMPACDSNGNGDASAEAVKSRRFEGFVLPGTAVDAKAMGFTDCKVDYYAAICRKPDAVLLGMKAPAVIRFDLTDGKMPKDLTELRYREIEFEVPKASFKYPCDANERANPFACFEPGQAVNLAQRLVNAGWKTREWKRTHDFVNPAYEVGVSMTEEGSIASGNGISLSYMPKAEVTDAVNRIEAEQAARRSREDAATGFEQSMASGSGAGER